MPNHHLRKIANLCSDGYLFDSLSQDEALTLKRLSSCLVESFQENERAGLLTRDYLSCNDGPVVRHLTRKLNKYFESNGINRLMSMYLGYNVEIGGLSVEMGSNKSTWWQSCYDNSPDTLYIHRDETTSLPKAFIYLANISDLDGPFSIFPDADAFHGSPTWLQNLIGRRISMIGRSKDHLSYGKFTHIYHQAFGDANFRSLFLSLPAEARYSSHYGWDLVLEDPVHDQMLKNELPLHGIAGCFIIFDGARVSHRALQKATNKHISLQAIFSPRRSYLRKAASSLCKPLKSLITK